jgi:hypothetical protein
LSKEQLGFDLADILDTVLVACLSDMNPPRIKWLTTRNVKHCTWAHVETGKMYIDIQAPFMNEKELPVSL